MPRKDYHDFIDFFDPLVEAFIDAVDDVRHSLVEEGWYGRAVTDDIKGPNSAGERDPNIDIDIDVGINIGNFYGTPVDDFEREWAVVEKSPDDKAIEPPGFGIDR